MSTSPDPRALIDGLADLLADQGWLTDPRWRNALHAVPRHLFVPPAGWATPDNDGVPGYSIDAVADPQTWWKTVYSDASIVTQVDDGAGDPATGEGWFTSSVSAPAVVVMFGELLSVRPGNRVLEVGTGSGWTASLMAHLAGPHGQVTSVEVDAALSERADTNIKAAALTGGAEITLVVGDAATLNPGELDGPYDRLHVTCGVSDIPWNWVEALRRGGTAVIPWSPPYGIGSKLRLVRTGENESVGRLHGSAGYMMLRSQRPEPGQLSDFLHHYDDRRVTTTRVDPRTVVRDDGEDWRTYGGDVAISAMAPGIRYDLCHAEDGTGEASLWLRETFPGARDTGSWALAEYIPGQDQYEVSTFGPRNLWAEVSNAYLRWCSLGRPDRDRYGITITPDNGGQTRVWLDHPAQVISTP